MAISSGLDLAARDLLVNPKDDFYQYCNGNWTDEIPEDKPDWGMMKKMRDDTLHNVHKLVEDIANSESSDANEQKIGIFWRAAMNLERIEEFGYSPLKPVFEDIDQATNKKEFMALVARIHRLGLGVFFGFGPESDMKDSHSTILWGGEGSLGLGSREYYFDDDKEDKRKAYVQHMEKMFGMTGFDNAKERAEKVMELELSLAQVAKTNTENRDLLKLYNPVEPRDLPAAWDWPAYFDVVGKDCLSLEECKIICLTNPKSLEFSVSAVTDDTVAAWKDYVRWHVIKGFSKYLSADFVEAHFQFFGKELSGQAVIEDRWKRVLSTINGSGGELLGAVYCTHYFPTSSKEAMLELVNNVTKSLRGMIEGLEWMDETTRAAALKKLSSFRVKIGYPDQFIDYTHFTPAETDSYFDIICKVNEFEHVRTYREANKPTDQEKWGMAPQEVNAYYHPLRNEIVFPAAILQGAAFQPNRDICANYGAIGAVIGHECTHGFDDQGRQFDHSGNMTNWWTEKDTDSFTKNKQPIIDQYSAYEVAPGQFVNGDLTQGENIADIGGLKCAYRALQTALEKHPEYNTEIDGLTPSQRFFIAWGQFWRTKSRPDRITQLLAIDPHSPGQARATEAPRNLQAFLDAFGITEGDKMYMSPETRGKVW